MCHIPRHVDIGIDIEVRGAASGERRFILSRPVRLLVLGARRETILKEQIMWKRTSPISLSASVMANWASDSLFEGRRGCRTETDGWHVVRVSLMGAIVKMKGRSILPGSVK